MVLVVEPEVMVAKVAMRRISAREAVASYCTRPAVVVKTTGWAKQGLRLALGLSK
jgi:hypothetical protein